MRRSVWLLWVALAGCGLGDPVASATVEQAARTYLERVYPERHGAPACHALGPPDFSASCDVIIDNRLRRLTCGRTRNTATEVTDLTCEYQQSL